MTLVELIKALKEYFKTNGDRELRPDVTVQSILADEPPAPSAPRRVGRASATTNIETVSDKPE